MSRMRHPMATAMTCVLRDCPNVTAPVIVLV